MEVVKFMMVLSGVTLSVPLETSEVENIFTVPILFPDAKNLPSLEAERHVV
tara:strand:- start:576 stop:728 length:153 start_codon:yes stop_codon:yes gene_type:complete